MEDKGRIILQYIPRNMHTVFALLCFVVVIHWLIFPYPSGLLHWHRGNLTIAPVPAKQPWWIWINSSCEFIMNDNITTTKQSTTKPCAYFLGYTVHGQKLWLQKTWWRKEPMHRQPRCWTRFPEYFVGINCISDHVTEILQLLDAFCQWFCKWKFCEVLISNHKSLIIIIIIILIYWFI